MAIMDENTQFEVGLYRGTADNMRISNAEPDGKTALQFVHFSKITGNHVDRAQIVGNMQIGDADLRDLSNMILQRLKQIDKAR
jgi:hypothetical protein